LSAESLAAAKAQAAVGIGNPLVLDPLAGLPIFEVSPYFKRNLRFRSAIDAMGRIRLCAMTIED
jgi:hypothetical protein